MLSLMAAARDARDELDDEDLHRMTMGVLLAGQVSTMYMIVNSVYALLTHPDQLEILRNDESLIPDAVDELLRFVAGLSHSAIQHRIAMEDAELSGVRIKAGDAVMVARAAANRDEDVFADPERLDIRRQGNPHLTFGHGTHACPGAHLARIEIQAALRALIHGLPGLALAVPESELRWLTGRPIRGPIEFPVTWNTQPASDRG
jgi:cytochrome P450